MSLLELAFEKWRGYIGAGINQKMSGALGGWRGTRVWRAWYQRSNTSYETAE